MSMGMLVGLNVTDDESYATYRDKMAPILERHGGSFGYDFRVAEVLRSESDVPINRIFTIRFPDELTMTDFFSNAEYLAVRADHFNASVGDTVIIARYETS